MKLTWVIFPSDDAEVEGKKYANSYLTYKEDGSLDWTFQRFFQSTEVELPEDEDLSLEDLPYLHACGRLEIEIMDGDNGEFNTVKEISSVDENERAWLLDIIESLGN